MSPSENTLAQYPNCINCAKSYTLLHLEVLEVLYNKTFYGCNYFRSVVSQSVCRCQSLSPQPNTSMQGSSLLLEWIPLRSSTLMVVSQTCLKYQTSVKMITVTSTLQLSAEEINNGCKKFYERGPSTLIKNFESTTTFLIDNEIAVIFSCFSGRLRTQYLVLKCFDLL